MGLFCRLGVYYTMVYDVKKGAAKLWLIWRSNTFHSIRTYTYLQWHCYGKTFFWVFSTCVRATPPIPCPFNDPMSPSTYSSNIELSALSSATQGAKNCQLRDIVISLFLPQSGRYNKKLHTNFNFGQNAFIWCIKHISTYPGSEVDFWLTLCFGLLRPKYWEYRVIISMNC